MGYSDTTKPGQPACYWGGPLAKLCGAIAVTLCAAGTAPAYAVQATCSSTPFTSDGAWQVNTQLTAFTKGALLATIPIKLTIPVVNVRGGGPNGYDTLLSWTIDPTKGATYPNFDAATQSVPLSAASGIGGRLTIRSTASSVYTRWSSYLPVVMTPIQTDVAYASPRTASDETRTNGSVIYYATYELVIVDAAKYEASDASIDALMPLIKAQRGPQIEVGIEAHQDSLFTYDWITCFNGLNSNNTLTSLPKLPTPLPTNRPTCTFSTGLTQKVTLESASQSQIAPYDSTRSAGIAGEKKFFITASNCAKGAIYGIYFTDTYHAGSTANYLAQIANNRVGIRLYHNDEQTPIPFGPAPVGSNMPVRTPIQYGHPGAAAGTSYVMPFTAQYVRLPGIASTPAGEVSAMATVTIVYP